MKRMLLFMFLLPAMSISAQELTEGFGYDDDGYVVWEQFYEMEIDDFVEVKDELLAQLGSDSRVRLSPAQPENKIVGRVEGLISQFSGLDAVIAWTYDFGFTIEFYKDGYVVRGRNFVGKTNSGAYGGGGANTMAAEEWLRSNGKKRKAKWCEANGVPARRMFAL